MKPFIWYYGSSVEEKLSVFSVKKICFIGKKFQVSVFIYQNDTILLYLQ